MKQVDIAIVGATGAVGEALLDALEEFNFPVGKLHLLASERSVGKTLPFKGKMLAVEDLAEFDFSQVQLAFFSAGGQVSAEWVPVAVKAGAYVIDNTSTFRYDDDIPLIVPEVNPEQIERAHQTKIIANPNCSTIQMLVVLKPIYDAVGISRINVATYQAVSGTGVAAISELVSQAGEMLNGRPIKDPQVYPHQIAFNVIPAIDTPQDNGYTREEMKMVWETQKIFGDDTVLVNPTAVRVPVLYGHSEAVHVETKQKISAKDAKALLKKAPGVKLIDDLASDTYPTPINNGSGQHGVSVGRVREDISHPNGLDLWVVADNVRKGAATNSVQIAELLLETLTK